MQRKHTTILTNINEQQLHLKENADRGNILKCKIIGSGKKPVSYTNSQEK